MNDNRVDEVKLIEQSHKEFRQLNDFCVERCDAFLLVALLFLVLSLLRLLFCLNRVHGIVRWEDSLTQLELHKLDDRIDVILLKELRVF